MPIPAPTTRHDAESQKVGVDIASTLGNAVNRHPAKHIAAGIAKGLLSEHRTLQQSAVGAVLHALVMYADEAHENGWTDLRNEAAIKNIRSIRQHLLDAAALPFI